MTPEELADEFQRLWVVRRGDDMALPREFLVATFRKIGAPDLREFSVALVKLLSPHLPKGFVMVDDLASPEDEEWRVLGVSKLDWLCDTMAKAYFNPQMLAGPILYAGRKDAPRKAAVERHAQERVDKQNRDEEIKSYVLAELARKIPYHVVQSGARKKFGYEYKDDPRRTADPNILSHRSVDKIVSKARKESPHRG